MANLSQSRRYQRPQTPPRSGQHVKHIADRNLYVSRRRPSLFPAGTQIEDSDSQDAQPSTSEVTRSRIPSASHSAAKSKTLKRRRSAKVFKVLKAVHIPTPRTTQTSDNSSQRLQITSGLKTPEIDPKAKRRSNRAEARKAVVYDQKIHPQDHLLPFHWKRTSLPLKSADTNKDSRDESGVEDLNEGVVSSDTEDELSGAEQEHERRGMKTHVPQPGAIRRPRRLEAQKAVNYDGRIHPNDCDIGWPSRRRPSTNNSKRQTRQVRTRTASSDDLSLSDQDSDVRQLDDELMSSLAPHSTANSLGHERIAVGDESESHNTRADPQELSNPFTAKSAASISDDDVEAFQHYMTQEARAHDDDDDDAYLRQWRENYGIAGGHGAANNMQIPTSAQLSADRLHRYYISKSSGKENRLL